MGFIIAIAVLAIVLVVLDTILDAYIEYIEEKDRERKVKALIELAYEIGRLEERHNG